jgi:hypothetical protein
MSSPAAVKGKAVPTASGSTDLALSTMISGSINVSGQFDELPEDGVDGPLNSTMHQQGTAAAADHMEEDASR